MNEEGVFLALTNKLTDVPDPDAPSRGLLARTVLGSSRSVREADTVLRDRDIGRYNPFLMIIVDSRGGKFIANGTEFENREIDSSPLRFFLSNHTGLTIDPDHELIPEPSQDWTGRRTRDRSLIEFCSRHDSFMERESLCLHKEIAGTRSSSILTVNDSENEFSYSYAPGHPCETDYSDVDVPSWFSTSVVGAWRN